jgi:hypothetical protein
LFVRQRDQGGLMTLTEISIVSWAILGMIAVAILLRYPERGHERRRENRD